MSFLSLSWLLPFLTDSYSPIAQTCFTYKFFKISTSHRKPVLSYWRCFFFSSFCCFSYFEDSCVQSVGCWCASDWESQCGPLLSSTTWWCWAVTQPPAALPLHCPAECRPLLVPHESWLALIGALELFFFNIFCLFVFLTWSAETALVRHLHNHC